MSLSAEQLSTFTLHLMAQALNIDANAIANTALTFVNGGTLDKHIPVLVLIEQASGGSLAAAVCDLVDDDANKIINAGSLAGTNSTTNWYTTTTAQLFKKSGNITFAISTPAGVAAEINVKVFGISY